MGLIARDAHVLNVAACYAFPHRASDKGIFDHPHEAGTAYNSISAVRFAELAIEKQLKRRGGRDSAAHPIPVAASEKTVSTAPPFGWGLGAAGDRADHAIET
jgi:hypothetical protein